MQKEETELPEEQKEEKEQPIRTEKGIAMDFAVKVHKKFDRLIKASVLFGSQTRNTATVTSDIDIILIVDDAAINWDMELVAWYREELAKIIAESKYSHDLHINTVKLTTWWQDLMYGDPIVINIIRYGEPLIDVGGFFNPLKSLLVQGKIRSTPEAVYVTLQRSPTHLARSRVSLIAAVEGIYWCMVDAAHAALITAGKLPPSPEHIPTLLKQTFVDNGMLNLEYVRYFRDISLLHKSILHNETHTVKGADVDKWQVLAEKFLAEMTGLIIRMLQK